MSVSNIRLSVILKTQFVRNSLQQTSAYASKDKEQEKGASRKFMGSKLLSRTVILSSSYGVKGAVGLNRSGCLENESYLQFRIDFSFSC
jgi:hypothetical protein